MCLFSTPSMPPVPVAASFQPTQAPKDLTQGKSAANSIRRRGLFASIFTSPQGITATPTTTGTTGGLTGKTGA